MVGIGLSGFSQSRLKRTEALVFEQMMSSSFFNYIGLV
jgi:hypothetical protein